MTVEVSTVADPPRSPIRESALGRRALAIWLRLDRRALTRCHSDPYRIVSLVAHRTTMPPEASVALVLLSDEDLETWFGRAEAKRRTPDGRSRSAGVTGPSGRLGSQLSDRSSTLLPIEPTRPASPARRHAQVDRDPRRVALLRIVGQVGEGS
jgi:hypothetical protein